MDKKREQVINILLAIILMISLVGDYCIKSQIEELQYQEIMERELFIKDYTDVLLDYMVYNTDQVSLYAPKVLGDAGITVKSYGGITEATITDISNSNKTYEFSKNAILDKAQQLQTRELNTNQEKILKLKKWDSVLFIIQIIIILSVIAINMKWRFK